MPAYEIRYLDKSNVLAARFRVGCRDDDEAKKLAHSIEVQMDAIRQIAVWEGQRLIFTKPFTKPVVQDKTAFEPAALDSAIAAAAPA
jgi:hypothetical protein